VESRNKELWNYPISYSLYYDWKKLTYSPDLVVSKPLRGSSVNHLVSPHFMIEDNEVHAFCFLFIAIRRRLET